MTTPPRTLNARLYAVLGLVAMLAPLSASFYLPGLPELAMDLGVSVPQAQLTLSASLIGLAIGQFFMGAASDRFGRRRPMIIGIAVFAIATALCAVAPSLPVLVALRFIQGLAGSVGPAISRATVRDVTTGNATGKALSRLLAIIGLAPVAGPLIGGLVLTVASWRGLFLALAVISAVSLLVTIVWYPETLPRESRLEGGTRGTRAAIAELLADRRVRIALGLTTLLGMVSFSWSAISSFYFIDWYGISPQSYAMIVALNSLAFVIGAVINGRLVARAGPRTALLRGLSLMAVGVLIIAGLTIVMGPWALTAGVTILTMGAYGGQIANAQTLGLGPHGRVAGTMSSLLGTAQFLGGAVIPPVVTWGLGPIAALPTLMVCATLAALTLTLAGVRRTS